MGHRLDVGGGDRLALLAAVQQDLQAFGIDLAAIRHGLHDPLHLLHRQGRFVGAHVREGVIDVGHRHDARLQGDLLGGQAQGIAAAIELLVMAGHHMAQHRHLRVRHQP